MLQHALRLTTHTNAIVRTACCKANMTTRLCSSAATILWHNPACSKSCAALDILREEANLPFSVREYLVETPTFDELQTLQGQLGMPPIEWVRTTDDAWLTHFDNVCIYDDILPDDDDILRGIVKHPVMIERPILVHNGKAAVCRPPEKVRSMLFAAAESNGPKGAEAIAQIAQLKTLLDVGAVTQVEFETKKRELLARI